MYEYKWIGKDNLFELSLKETKLQMELRPVFTDEIRNLSLDKFIQFEGDTDVPVLWAEGIRHYINNGIRIAEAKGGNFYEMPTIMPLDRKKIKVHPINIDKLWNLNRQLMDGLVEKAICFIRKTYEDYVQRGYLFVVAFSGGKDSLALLDLVQRALAPDQFVVIFGDTGMELQSTYQAVEDAQKIYPMLRFMTARSVLDANESWSQFGPPGRRLRWCCAIHKSVPTLLLLRKMSGGKSIKAVVFDGVRAEESLQRSSYLELSEGNKHTNQVNCRPLLEWGSAELYLYLLHRNILINKAYRNGLFRVGCAVCPMSSGWWDGIANNLYKDDLAPFVKYVEDYARSCKIESGVYKYIKQGGWKARMGGNNLPQAYQKITETLSDDTITFQIKDAKQSWIDVAPILGSIVERDHLSGVQVIRNSLIHFNLSEDGTTISYSPFSKMDRFAVSYLRAAVNKVAYCVGCHACNVECQTGAFSFTDQRILKINPNLCVHCMKCITEIPKGCWAARSLAITGDSSKMDMNGLDRYCHFGFRQEWLEHFFDLRNDCWNSKLLGNKQYDSLRRWLRDSELQESIPGKKHNEITSLCESLLKLGPYNPLTWAIIWCHLAYNSVLIRWFIFMCPVNEPLDKNEFVSILDDTLSPTTRSNGILSLLDTFNNSPIGSSLEMGIPVSIGKTKKYLKQGWSTPDPWALLYALYLYAEKIGNHYDFTLREMLSIGKERKFDLPAVDPITIFALNPDNVKEQFRELSNQYPKYIRTSFVAGLDNIQLDPKITSLDILKQAVAEEA